MVSVPGAEMQALIITRVLGVQPKLRAPLKSHHFQAPLSLPQLTLELMSIRQLDKNQKPSSTASAERLRLRPSLKAEPLGDAGWTGQERAVTSAEQSPFRVSLRDALLA